MSAMSEYTRLLASPGHWWNMFTACVKMFLAKDPLQLVYTPRRAGATANGLLLLTFNVKPAIMAAARARFIPILDQCRR